MVRDPDSRPHFHEAVLAFLSGAYRAAVVETWVAVAVDLTNKIRYLAESGDSSAKAAVNSLEIAIKNRDVAGIQNFERDLINECEKTYELITSREAFDLRRLNEDRNYCAHPAFVEVNTVFSPTAELARAHLAIAVDCALSLPPVSGKRTKQNLMRDLDSHSWPIRDVANFLRTSYLERTRSNVRKEVVRFLLNNAVTLADPTELSTIKPNVLAARCRSALQALHDINPELLEEVVTGAIASWDRLGTLTDEKIIRLIGSLGNLPLLWRSMQDGHRMRATSLLSTSPTDFLVKHRCFSAGQPVDDEVASAYRAALKVTASDFVTLERAASAGTNDRRQWIQGSSQTTV